MLGTTFYHNILRKTTIGFGTIFNSIYYIRKIDSTDEDSQKVEQKKVPLVYGPQQKWYKRLVTQTRTDELNPQTKIEVPIMAFQISGINYDPTRKTSGLITRAKENTTPENTTVKYRYNRVPYEIDFSLAIMVKNLDDGLQIIEQILPYFQPQYTIAINFTDLDEKFDMDVTYQGISIEDTDTGALGDSRILTFTLSFKCKSYLIGPIQESGLITQVEANFYKFGTEERFESIVVTPPAGATVGTELSGATGFGIDITTYDSGLT